MADPDEFVDYYALLDLPHTSTARQIAKAYRVKSLIYHPDKSTGSTELFHTLKKAFDTLRDPSLRSPYDDTYRARLERKIRHEEMDARRKAGREDLEAREDAARRKCKVDIKDVQMSQERERIREEGMRGLREAERKGAENEGKLRMQAMDHPDGTEATLKCKWKTREGEDEITQGSLDELFRPFGDIESIVLKNKSKGSNALISFSSILSANNAMEKLNGGRIKIAWLDGEVSGKLEVLKNREHVPVAMKSGVVSMKPSGQTDQEYEDDTLARMMSMKR